MKSDCAHFQGLVDLEIVIVCGRVTDYAVATNWNSLRCFAVLVIKPCSFAFGLSMAKFVVMLIFYGRASCRC